MSSTHSVKKVQDTECNMDFRSWFFLSVFVCTYKYTIYIPTICDMDLKVKKASSLLVS